MTNAEESYDEYSEEEECEKTLEDVYEFYQDEIMFQARIMYEKMRYEMPWILDKCDFLTFFKFLMFYNSDLKFLEKINGRYYTI